MTSNNLCNSCSNYGCEFQSGIVRTECAFYMPPPIESDNCGNYVVIQPTVNVLDKIRAEITHRHLSINEKSEFDNGRTYAYEEVIDIINKYRSESEEK